MLSIPAASIDFESRSACSLRKSGAWKYSIDPTTEILCLAYRLPAWESGRVELWAPAFPHLGIAETYEEGLYDFIQWVESGGLLAAWNASFERCMWTNILTTRFGWPLPSISQWKCSAAKAAAHALPRGLEGAGSALALSIVKDTEGAKAMKKAMKPRKSWKKERDQSAKTGIPLPNILWHESRELFEKVWAYCRVDILAEEAISQTLPDLSPEEQTIYTLDQTINERGFQLDGCAVSTALHLIAGETKRLNGELSVVTGGKVQKATQRAQMIKWFASEGLDLPDTQKETIDDLLDSQDLPNADNMPDSCKRGLEIIRTLGRSSTAKYEAMKNWMDPHDNRIRGGLLYHGATTGRWSGSGVQPHNFVRGSIKDMDGLWEALKAGRPFLRKDGVAIDLMVALSEGLRGAIVAAEGKSLFVADYAAIEARVVMWLAGEKEALNIFRTGADIYLDMASDIYGYPCNKKDHSAERQIGKIAILGLGYQMGASKFRATCEKGGSIIDEEFAQSVVSAFREKYWRVKQMWWDQEDAAISAVLSNRPVTCGYVSWVPEGSFLYCVLPSGRRIAYPFPEIRPRSTPWGAVKNSLTFMGIHPLSRKWVRQTTYGGSLVENITQSVARDVMAEAMLRCELSSYPVVLSVHDEGISERAGGDLDEFLALMSKNPKWSVGLPIACEGFVTRRYKK